MRYRQRLLWMAMASLITTAIVYYVTDLTVTLVRGFSGDLASYALMILISMIGLLVSNVPALLLMWWRKYPNAIVVSSLAAIQGFLISYILIPLVSYAVGFGYWALSMFVSVLTGYLVVDGILNALRWSARSKTIVVGSVLVCSALLATLFLVG
jgi:hypothetical protein